MSDGSHLELSTNNIVSFQHNRRRCDPTLHDETQVRMQACSKHKQASHVELEVQDENNFHEISLPRAFPQKAEDKFLEQQWHDFLE